MLKYSIILLNLLGIIGYKMLFPGGVGITSDFPANLSPGDEFIVTVSVTKGDLTGFAKFTQQLPNGFSAILVNDADATFSYKDQDVKFIWVALPSSSEVSFSYKVKIDPSVSGKYKIGGTFSYIYNNEKQSAELAMLEVIVGKENTQPGSAIAAKGKAAEKGNEIQCRRTTAPIAGLQNTFKVELRIDKPGISGFTKIEESIPDGFYASEMESKGGIFSFNDQLMKIIWMAVPEENQFIIAYKLTAREDVSGNQKISGIFSYLIGDNSFKYSIAPSTIFIEKDDGDEIPTIIIADEGGNFKEKELAQAEPEPIKEAEVVQPPPVAESKPIPDPQTTVSYSVQVAAGHNPVPYAYFSKKFQLKEDIKIENHEGWIKYTFGKFSVYRDSRDKRNKVWSENKITDAFVTAYNAGQRITVQEALMISNQKWYN